MPLDPKRIGQALREELTLHSTLCRREAPAFQRALSGDEPVLGIAHHHRCGQGDPSGPNDAPHGGLQHGGA